MARTRAVASRRRRKPIVRRNRRKLTLKRIWKPLLLIVAAVGICIGFFYTVSNPSLRISKVKVTGTNLVDPKEVENDVWHMLNNEHGVITKHRNILFFPKRRIAAYINRRPEIMSISIGRVLPRTLIVNVAERRAAAIVTDGSNSWLVDQQGTLFHRAIGTKVTAPLVILPADSITTDGKCAAKKAMKDALACLQTCREYKIDTTKISVDREGNVCFNISGSLYAKLGQPIDMRAKIAKVARMLKREPDIGERVIYIDVSCVEFPVVKPKSG